MMDIIIFIFAVFGLVEIIIIGGPTKPIRKLFSLRPVSKKFIHCPLCLGFWMGGVLGYWLMPLSVPWYFAIFFNGFIGSGASYFLHKLVTPIEFRGE